MSATLTRGVFPLHADKSPAVPSWRGASRPQEAWTHPVNMWGVECGHEFFVVDLDSYNGNLPAGEERWLDLFDGRTFTVQTRSGGQHAYFRMVEGITNAGGLRQRVDIRGLGGYVVSPSSDGYAVAHDVPIADAPEWLISRLVTATRTVDAVPMPDSAPDELAAELGDLLGLYTDHAPDKMRSEWIYKLELELFRRGWSLENVFSVMRGCTNVLGKGWSDANLWRDVLDAHETVTRESTQARAFWERRPELQAIHDNARRVDLAPWGALGVALLRACQTIPHNVVYQSYKGLATLNLFGVFAGPSGAGKTLVQTHTDASLYFRGHSFTPIEVGSGEAIADLFAKAGKSGDLVWRNDAHVAAIAFDEVSRLDSMNKRSGTTVLDYLKSGWSGAALGRKLKDDAGIVLPAGSYRMTAFINAQPARADVLLNADEIAGGFPGRLLWLSMIDTSEYAEDMTPVVPHQVVPVDWKGVKAVHALPVMNAAHKAHALKTLRGTGTDALEGHELLARAKVAVALMVLNGRRELNAEDWELSGVVIEHSRATRQAVQTALTDAAKSVDQSRGKAQGYRDAVASDVAEQHNVQAAANLILNRLKVVSSLTYGETNQALGSRRRDYRDDAIALLVEQGAVTFDGERLAPKGVNA